MHELRRKSCEASFNGLQIGKKQLTDFPGFCAFGPRQMAQSVNYSYSYTEV
jgi:hypothetical protein